MALALPTNALCRENTDTVEYWFWQGDAQIADSGFLFTPRQ
jgi:hypothetical protein